MLWIKVKKYSYITWRKIMTILALYFLKICSLTQGGKLIELIGWTMLKLDLEYFISSWKLGELLIFSCFFFLPEEPSCHLSPHQTLQQPSQLLPRAPGLLQEEQGPSEPPGLPSIFFLQLQLPLRDQIPAAPSTEPGLQTDRFRPPPAAPPLY